MEAGLQWRTRGLLQGLLLLFTVGGSTSQHTPFSFGEMEQHPALYKRLSIMM